MASRFPLRTFGVAAVTCLLAVPGCVDIVANDVSHIEREERRLTVQGTPSLTLATFDGAIEVLSSDRPEVLVEIEKRGIDKEAADSIRVEISQNLNEISVQAKNRTGGDRKFLFGRQPSAALRITVPRAAHVRARSGDGRIEVRELRGDVTVETGDGSIRIEAVDGAVDAQSGDGSIRVDGALTRLRARSGDGSVVIRAADGSLADADWSISTGDGSVTLELPARFDAELDAQTGDGRVVLRGTELSGEQRTGRRAVHGRLGAGGRNLRVRTGDGSITIRQF